MLQKDLIDNHAITNRPQGPSHHGENRPKKVAPPSGATALGGHTPTFINSPFVSFITSLLCHVY